MSYRQSDPSRAYRMWPFVAVDDGTGDPDATLVDHTNVQRQKLGGAFANVTNDPIALTGITGAWWVELTPAELDTVGPLGMRVEKAPLRTIVTWEDVLAAPSRPDFFVGEADASRRVFPFIVVDYATGDPINTLIDKTNVQIFKLDGVAAANVATDPVAIASQDGAYELTFTVPEIDTPGLMCVCISKPGVIRTIIYFVTVAPRAVAAVVPVTQPLPSTLAPTPTRVTRIDHAQAAVDRLVEQLRGKPNLEAFLRAMCEPMNELDDAFVDFITLFSVDNAVGDQLRILAGKVGQDPLGLADDPATYDLLRAFIRARVRTNKSAGLVDQLLAIARLVLRGYAAQAQVAAAGTMRLYLRNHGFAAFTLQVMDVDLDWTLASYCIHSFLDVAKAAGVDVQLAFMPQTGAAYNDHDDAFELGDISAPSTSATTGLGDTNSATGGIMTSVME